MKILYIVQQFCGPSGNWGTRPYENTRRLVQKGHEVTLLCGKFDRSVPEDISHALNAGIDIYQAPITFAQRYSYLRRMLVFKQFDHWAYGMGTQFEKPDLVFASSPPLTVGDLGRKIAAYHKVPFVFEVRDLWPEMPLAVGALKNPVLRWMANRMARRVYGAADHVVALSPGMKERILDWGVPSERVTVIPNCSDTDLFGGVEYRESMRERMGWGNKFVCIYPGSMGFVNGLDYLLDCAKVLDARGVENVHIALLGDGAFKAHLKARVEAEGIRCAAVYDPIPKRDMPKLMSAADLGLVCFRPITMMEANSANKLFDMFASRLPVIINYRGWQEDVLRESGAGLSVDRHNPAAMADAILNLRDDPHGRAVMGQKGRRLAEERYDRDMLAGQLEQLLCEVVARRRSMGWQTAGSYQEG